MDARREQCSGSAGVAGARHHQRVRQVAVQDEIVLSELHRVVEGRDRFRRVTLPQERLTERRPGTTVRLVRVRVIDRGSKRRF